MKYLIYPLLAVALLFSCKKEMITNEDQENIQTPEITASTSGLPTTITATLSDNAVKTIYDSDGVFSWYKGETSEDRIQLLVVQDLTTFTKQGVYTYKVKSLSDDKKTAVFTSTSSAGDLMNYTDGAWKSTGIAIYPTGMNRDGDNEYGLPYIKLPQKVSGETKDIVLTGVPMGDNSNFKFSTAMGIIKITINDIPANAKQIRLYTNNKDTYPIDGDFMLQKDESGIVTIHSTDYKKYNSGTTHSANDYIYVELNGEESKTVYLNLPVASYPAETLTLKICDANGGMIMKRTINKELSITRNECLSVPELTIVENIFVGGNVTTPRFCWTFDSKQVIFTVNQTETFVDSDLDAFPSGYKFTNGKESRYTYVGSDYPEGYAMTALSPNPFESTGSGKYYLHYVVLSSTTKPNSLTDANVVKSGTVPFYYLSSSDKTSFVGTLSCSYSDGGQNRTDNPNSGVICHPGTASGYDASMKLAESDDLSKGNVKLTYLYKQTADSGHELYGCLDNTSNKLTFPYAGETNEDFFFKSWNNNYFHVASCSAVTFNGSTLSSTADGDLSFTISGGELTHTDYLMMKYTSISYSSWDAFVYGKGLVFSK